MIVRNGNKQYEETVCPGCREHILITTEIVPGFSDYGNVKCLCGYNLGERRIDNGYEVEYR